MMTLFQRLFVLLLLVPLLELYLLIQVGSVVGALPTVVLVVFTAALGAYLLRAQGFSTLRRVQDRFAQGEVPALEMMGGLILLVCGILLLTPGFITDIIGFLGLIPSLRQFLVLWCLQKKGVTFTPGGSSDNNKPGKRTLEGEYWHEDD